MAFAGIKSPVEVTGLGVECEKHCLYEAQAKCPKLYISKSTSSPKREIVSNLIGMQDSPERLLSRQIGFKVWKAARRNAPKID